MKLYIAGPMSGLPDYNFRTFRRATADLRRRGYDVVSPHELDGEPPQHEVTREEWCEYLTRDLREVLDVDALAVLPGWRNSEGATLEVDTARRLDKPVYAWNALEESGLGPVGARPLVGLTGHAKVGKDTTAAIMRDLAGFRRVAFADALKRIASAIGWQGDKYEKWPGAEQWLAKRYNVPIRLPGRVLLQRLGVAVREELGEDTWVNRGLDEADLYGGSKVVVTDVRFDNEAEAIRARGGVVVKVHRPGFGPVNDHVSDAGIDPALIDATLVNDGTLDDLTGRTRTLLAFVDTVTEQRHPLPEAPEVPFDVREKVSA